MDVLEAAVKDRNADHAELRQQTDNVHCLYLFSQLTKKPSALQDQDKEVRHSAVVALGEIQDGWAFELVGGTQSSGRFVRWGAELALSRINVLTWDTETKTVKMGRYLSLRVSWRLKPL